MVAGYDPPLARALALDRCCRPTADVLAGAGLRHVFGLSLGRCGRRWLPRLFLSWRVDDGAATTKEGTSVLLSTSKGILAINSTSKLGLGNVQNLEISSYIQLLTSGTWGDHGMTTIPDTEFIGVSLELGWIAG